MRSRATRAVSCSRARASGCSCPGRTSSASATGPADRLHRYLAVRSDGLRQAGEFALPDGGGDQRRGARRGLELAMHCDGLLASPSPKGKPYPVGLPEAGAVDLSGLGRDEPAAGTDGPGDAITLTAQGKPMTFDEACEQRLFDRVIDDPSQPSGGRGGVGAPAADAWHGRPGRRAVPAGSADRHRTRRCSPGSTPPGATCPTHRRPRPWRRPWTWAREGLGGGPPDRAEIGLSTSRGRRPGRRRSRRSLRSRSDAARPLNGVFRKTSSEIIGLSTPSGRSCNRLGGGANLCCYSCRYHLNRPRLLLRSPLMHWRHDDHG